MDSGNVDNKNVDSQILTGKGFTQEVFTLNI